MRTILLVFLAALLIPSLFAVAQGPGDSPASDAVGVMPQLLDAAPVEITDANSREVSVFRPYPVANFTDAISREVSVFAYEGPHPTFTDAVSREVSVYTTPAPVELTDAISREVSVFSIIPITLGTPYNGVLAPGTWLYFSLTTPANLTLRIDLDHASATAWTELYASFGKVPDTINAEFSSESPEKADQELIVPNTQAGTYYILARSTTDSNSCASKAFQLTANDLPFGLRSITPEFVGAGVATVQINGARFTNDTTFAVRDATAGRIYAGLQSQILDPASAWVTFDMTDASIKRFDVLAREPGMPEAILSGGLEIVPPTDTRFIDLTFSLPAKLRGGRPANGTITVTNRGNVDIPIVDVVLYTGTSDDVLIELPEITDARIAPASSGNNMGVAIVVSPLPANSTRVLNVQITPGTSFPAHGTLAIAADATPYSTATFRDGPLTEISEKTRLSVLTEPNLPSSLFVLANDSVRWHQVVNDYFDEHGFTTIAGSTGGSGGVANIAGGVLCGAVCLIVCDAIGYATLGVGGFACAGGCGGACDWCVSNPKACGGFVACMATGPVLAAGCMEIIQSWDPNEKDGPAGFGDNRFVRGDEQLGYKVSFENLAQATAPAAEIRISDVLDPSLDLSSVRVTGLGFGNIRLEFPNNRNSIATVLDLSELMGVLVSVTGGVDVNRRTLEFGFRALDPDTLQIPDDPSLGFLPPNVVQPEGEGFVEFTLKPLRGVSTGTKIRNKASIMFDYNDPIATDEVLNTVDSASPTSAVLALPDEVQHGKFQVCWEGADDNNGAGVANYSVFVSDNGSAYDAWTISAVAGCLAFDHGIVGHSYRFYSNARDNVGQVEPLHVAAEDGMVVEDAKTMVEFGDFNVDGIVDAHDYQQGEQVAMYPCLGGPRLSRTCEVNDFDADGDVDLRDIAELQTVTSSALDFGIGVRCLSGPRSHEPVPCNVTDFDLDGAIDLFDFAAFQVGFGAGR